VLIFEVYRFFFIQNAKPGEFDLHFLHVPEARERADRIIEEASSKGDRKVRFITGWCYRLIVSIAEASEVLTVDPLVRCACIGKGIHSRSGPKILPALRDHLARYVVALRTHWHVYGFGFELTETYVRRGLKYEQDPENAGILTVYLQDPET
jgi:hypothetical protein